MNRPSGFSFLGKTYSIDYVPEILLPEEEKGVNHEEFESIKDLGLLGTTFHISKNIQVKDGLDTNEEVDTTFHETIHALDYILELEMSERQVKVLATALIALLETNQPLREYLYENTKS